MVRRGASVAAALTGTLIALSATAGIAAATPEGAEVVPMTSIVRACDFTVAEFTWRTGDARALALVHRDSAASVAVEVQLLTALPNTDYYVKVFQMPRASYDCAVTPVGMRTDGAGAATVTVRTPINPGATGLWVSVERPSPYSQQPAEFYTSDYIVAL
jgi:hypothetical protein